MPESIEHSYESEEEREQPITAEDRRDAVFEADESNEELTVDSRISFTRARVVLPNADGRISLERSSNERRETIEPSSVVIYKALRLNGDTEYTYREGANNPESYPATPELIELFESTFENRDQEHQDGEPVFLEGRDVIRMDNYVIVTPSSPLEGQYPLILNLESQEFIGFHGTYGTEIEYVNERRLPRWRREDRAENADIRRIESRNHQWRSLITVPDPAWIETMIEEANEGSYNYLNSAYGRWTHTPGAGNSRASNYIEEQEYFRVIQAAGLEDYMPEGVEID